MPKQSPIPQPGADSAVPVSPTRAFHLVPLDRISGFDVRPGFYDSNGATAIPGGVNFTVHSRGATSVELLLFHREQDEPFAVLPFPEHYRIGNVYSMIVFKLNIQEFEYAYRVDGPYEPERGLIYDKTRYLLDPYAKAVTGQSGWGKTQPHGQHYKARVVKDDFDWGSTRNPLIPMEDLIIYELHVRGYTMDDSSNVRCPGTFAGLMEKLPYLEELGVNAVELMPIFEFDEMLDYREVDGQKLYNYWGYNTVSFFAPNTSYTASAEYNREGNELKRFIQACKQKGIEVYLDVVFNHTAEGNEMGPFFSFKGFDNNIYYLLTPEGYYYNFSGCGNTLNCNHPIVHQMIIDCLRYWVTPYHISGFRFDLASILGRNEDGSPMNKPPLLQAMAFDPILGDVKLIAEAWDAGGLYQVGSFPAWNRWAEWNGRYRDDLRRYLKGDEGCAQGAALRLSGSPDMYGSQGRTNASVNFITCHDGFTLWDLFSYNQKHNEANGEANRDGTDVNYSWNCGEEGPSRKKRLLKLRSRQLRNAFTILLLSQGTPLIYAGDERGNSQSGNNNAWCQDNELSWIPWKTGKTETALLEFVKGLIAFRKAHPVFHQARELQMTDYLSCGYPDVSFHGKEAWQPDTSPASRSMGVMFCGYYGEIDGRRDEDFLYFGVNLYWEPYVLGLPKLPRGKAWRLYASTDDQAKPEEESEEPLQKITIPPRTIVLYTTKDCPVSATAQRQRRRRGRNAVGKESGKREVSS